MGFIRRAKRWGKLIFAGGIFILIIAYYRLVTVYLFHFYLCMLNLM